jgi:L-asparaginase
MAGKSVLMLYAGGTIGMVAGRSGLVPGRRFVAQLESWISRQRDLVQHEIRITAFDPLIDSADAKPATWLALAQHIWTMRSLVDAVVVLHGTDTLAYTASAVSFFLIGFGKPVVLTGARVPFSMSGSDGETNMRGALKCAVEGSIREVGVFFDGRLMRGNRTRKWSTENGDAFASPHWPALAQMGRGLRIAHDALLAPSAGSASPPHVPSRSATVGLIKLYPGISDAVISAAADAHSGGLVLELYGAGTGPATDGRMRQAFQAIASRGIPLVGVSQCFRGRITPGLYAAGQALAECGVVNGYDLTPEAALTKLTYLHHLAVPPARIASEIARALAGEVTAPGA